MVQDKSKKAGIISLTAIIVVLALGLGLLGIQVHTEKTINENLINKISDLEAQNSKILKDTSSKNNELSNELNSKNRIIEDLQKQLNSLKKQVSDLQGVKAKPSTDEKNKALEYYKSQNTGPKVCYLTFDDGPSENTLKILNVLEAGNAKATFFVMSTPKLGYIKKAYDLGHTIGLHTNTHNWELYKTEETYYADLYAIREKVKNLIGTAPNIIRFPGGSSNSKSKNYNKGIMARLVTSVTKKGFYYFDWNVDSEDAAGNNVPAETLLNNIKAQSKNKSAICVLMHDTDSKNTTVEALPYIISYLRSEGFRFEALRENSPVFHHKKLNNGYSTAK